MIFRAGKKVNMWVLSNRLPRGLAKGPFQVRVVSDSIEVSRIRSTSLQCEPRTPFIEIETNRLGFHCL
jgi:hypothetical protein